jgi:hypothetical protein
MVQFTIAAMIRYHFSLSGLSPKATVYRFQANLLQNTTYTSPRDGKSVKSTDKFVVAGHGTLPPKAHLNPGKDMPAIWRGIEVGGKDDNEFKLDLSGRLPNDLHGRPSTPTGYVVVPISLGRDCIPADVAALKPPSVSVIYLSFRFICLCGEKQRQVHLCPYPVQVY